MFHWGKSVSIINPQSSCVLEYQEKFSKVPWLCKCNLGILQIGLVNENVYSSVQICTANSTEYYLRV